LWLIEKTLAFRAQHEGIFNGDYEPVFPLGENAECAVAFIRGGSAMTVVPRFTHSVAGEMPVLHLPDGKWRNEFTGENFSGEVGASDLLKKFPVALLVRE
jgi:(1->4)-alpha-D-glucan 1-alpha-D-glucosylmutase